MRGLVWNGVTMRLIREEPLTKAMYLYGGDHGEYPHDGNFCMDGLVYPDRRPHTGLMEFKNVNRPVRVVSFDQRKKNLPFIITFTLLTLKSMDALVMK